jgi:glucokinase
MIWRRALRTVIGIDLGGTNIVSAVINERGEVLGKDKRPTLAKLGAKKVMLRIADSVHSASQQSGLSWSSHLAVGIGSPGPLDQNRGVIIYTPNLNWHNVPIVNFLQKKLHKRVYLENDANAATLGESWVGAGMGEKVVFCVTLGTGVGGGLVIDGHIYHGATGVSNHLGHVIVDPDGPKSSYGNKGILEQYASALGIVRLAKKMGLKPPSGQKATPKTFKEMALDGNPKAIKVFEMAGRMLGIGLTSAIHLLNPSVIIFSGGVSHAGNVLFKPMYKEINTRCFKSHLKGLKFRMAKLGDNMGAVGAARLAWQALNKPAK